VRRYGGEVGELSARNDHSRTPPRSCPSNEG
jgi:hypothetical protein